jgi:hypothetical protein
MERLTGPPVSKPGSGFLYGRTGVAAIRHRIHSLVHSTGQFVSTLYTGFLQKGERKVPLQRPAVTTGTYFLKVQAKGENKTIPFTLQ